MKFSCIDDKLWGFIQPLLPPFASEGRPRADDRRTINAILYVLKTGIPWNDLTEEYGDDVTAWRRLKEWEEKGVWKRVMDALISKGLLDGRLGHGYSLHRQRHDSGQKGGALVGFDGHKRVEGTKVHAAVTEGSLPVAVMVGSGNEHEGRKMIPLMESISIRHGKGRPRKRPGTVYADTKYAMPLNRYYLDGKHVRSQIPDPPTKTKKRPGRPRLFDKERYHGVRYNVERFFGWLENYRKITVRYERLPNVFLGLIRLACSMILWRVLK